MSNNAKNIFDEEGHWKVNAFLGTGHEAWSTYAEAYYSAGRALWEKTCELQAPVDYMVYPMLFCYRHYLELKLKDFLIGMKFPGESTLEIEGISSHGLMKLWKPVRDAMTLYWESIEEDLERVEKTIADFEMIDTSSFVFRYPVNRGHQASLAADRVRMNISKIGIHMSEIWKTFVCIEQALWELKEEETLGYL